MTDLNVHASFNISYLTLNESDQLVIDQIMERGRRYLAAGNLMYAAGAFYKAHRKQERLDRLISPWPPDAISAGIRSIMEAEDRRILEAFENTMLGKTT